MPPEELLRFVLSLRTNRRKSIITAATNRAAKASAKQPKQNGIHKKAAGLISGLTAEQAQALLDQLRTVAGPQEEKE